MHAPRMMLLPLALGMASGCYTGLSGVPEADERPEGPGMADGDGETPDPVSESDEVAPLPLRRLTQHELRHTLDDLLGVPFEPASTLPSDARGSHGFIEGGLVAVVDARNLSNLAEELGAVVATRAPILVPCDPAGAGETACAQQFVEQFGRRAYRRPLEPAEVDGLVALYEDARAVAELDHFAGLGAVAEAMVQSPHFLYRRELGSHVPDAVDGVVVLTQDEIASRLSYLLWSSLPDDALFAAADGNELNSAEQLEAQARRMLEDPRASRMVDDFHLQWLEVEGTSSTVKDTNAFPQATAELMASMEEETRRFVRWAVLGDGAGTLEVLLTSPQSLVDAPLAALYGVPAPEEPFSLVALDPAQRAGVLTQASFLARHAGTAFSNPARRGKTMATRLLCRPMPPPPDDIPALEPPTEGSTTRQQFEQHSTDDACRSCHSVIDPLGFSLEHYDAIGGFRQLELGAPVDASGTLVLDGREVAFTSAVELAPHLAASQDVQRCLASQWFRYAIGRAELDADEGSIEAIHTAFEESGFEIRELIVAIVTSPTFRERAQNPGEEIQ